MSGIKRSCLNIYIQMLPSDHLRRFQSKVRSTRRLLARQIELFSVGSVPRTELEAIYELAFLNVFVAFENDLTELFKTNLLMGVDSKGRVRSLFAPKNRPLAERLLVGSNRYFQLLPVEQMEKAARVYLKDGGPFVCLSKPQKDAVAKAYAVRNHIAHRSQESRSNFKKKVLDYASLPRTSYAPGYYLRNELSMGVTYFDHHIAEVGGCLRTICELS